MQTKSFCNSVLKYLTKTRLIFVTFLVIIVSCKKDLKISESNNPLSIDNAKLTAAATVTPFATGFNNPRGLEFGPDGYLYVAEAGVGGTNNSSALCPELSGDDPYLGSPTGGRISKVNPTTGERTDVSTSLPSAVSGMGDVLGVADVTFIGNTLYALLSGGGCSHGVPSIPNGIVKVNSDGSISVVADLGSWQVTHPELNPPPDIEPEGTWYSLSAVHGDLYALDPNHSGLVKVTTDGSITRVADITATQGHIVPTALAYKGNFYVGNLNTFPIVDGSSNIYKITPSGETKIAETGFTTVLGLVFDNRDRMYVLENTTGNNMFPTPFTGTILRVNPNGTRDVVASGLPFPTGMTLGPDGNLYVSIWGFGQPPGGGEVWKVTL